MVSVLALRRLCSPVLRLALPAILLSNNHVDPTHAAELDVRLIAHRGGVVDSGLIENNVPAVEAAIGRGYWMLEVDVRESKDGELVVHHDATFERFYGDKRKLGDMTWDEIAALRSTPGDLRPLKFAEYAKACRGRIGVMLDTKPPEHPPQFLERMERTLRENDLLDEALFIGTAQSKEHFKNKAKISVNRQELQQALDAGEDVAELYFLFVHGRDLDEETVKLAQQRDVLVVPSVNVFHYYDLGKQGRAAAERDLRRLRNLGVDHFQIDSVYDHVFIGAE